MADRFDATMKAFDTGLEDVKPAAAIKLLEEWEAALTDLSLPGVDAILNHLEALKDALGEKEIDEEEVLDLMAELGAATTKIAAHAGEAREQLEALGEILSDEAGVPEGEEADALDADDEDEADEDDEGKKDHE